MAAYVYWFILALVLLGLEMTSGTFYLLVLSIALAVGGLAALLGLSLPLQLVASALTAIAGIVMLRRRKGGKAAERVDQSLDIGQTVRVVSWGEHGKARVHYRGTEWDAELVPADAQREGELYIRDMRGSVLIVSHDKPL